MVNEDVSASSLNTQVQRYFNQVIELEKQLRMLIDAKESGSRIQNLRQKICDIYKLIVLEDHTFAENHDVEQAIWRLHYRQIDEYRAKIRNLVSLNTEANISGINAPIGVKNNAQIDSLQKIFGSFRNFLSEAKGFYHDLISKLKEKYGLPQESFSYMMSRNNEIRLEPQNFESLKKCWASCHRCLIYLGDISRYQELYGQGKGHNHDWSVAAAYYLEAVSLWPSNGNPHNQLAVLATYVGDELLAVYRYFRSLALETPFVTARDNLNLLFEKNQEDYSQLVVSSKEQIFQYSNASENAVLNSDGMLGSSIEFALKEMNLNGLDIVVSEIRKKFCTRFVRLIAILFTRRSLETLPDVCSATIYDLKKLLALDDKYLESGLSMGQQFGIENGRWGAFGILQIVFALIFSVQNAKNDSRELPQQETFQCSSVLKSSLVSAFEFLGLLMHRCACSDNVMGSPLLPAILVFVEWLVRNTEMALASVVDETHADRNSIFWRHCAALLNKMHQFIKVDTNIGVSDTNCVAKENDDGMILWEDYELQGFIRPIKLSFPGVGYSASPVIICARGEKEWQLRVQRLLAAGKNLGRVFEGTEKGLTYDSEKKMFFVPEERKKKGHELISTSDLSPQQWQYTSAGASKMSPVEPKQNLCLKDTSLRTNIGDDDDDIILFKPVSKNTSTSCSMHDPYCSCIECDDILSKEFKIKVSVASTLSRSKSDISENTIGPQEHLLSSSSHPSSCETFENRTCQLPVYCCPSEIQYNCMLDSVVTSTYQVEETGPLVHSSRGVVGMADSSILNSVMQSHGEQKINQASNEIQFSNTSCITSTGWTLSSENLVPGINQCLPSSPLKEEYFSSYCNIESDGALHAQLGSLPTKESINSQIQIDDVCTSGFPEFSSVDNTFDVCSSYCGASNFETFKTLPSAPTIPDGVDTYFSSENTTDKQSLKHSKTESMHALKPSVSLEENNISGNLWMGQSTSVLATDFFPDTLTSQLRQHEFMGTTDAYDNTWPYSDESYLMNIEGNAVLPEWDFSMLSSKKVWSYPSNEAASSGTYHDLPWGIYGYSYSKDGLVSNIGDNIHKETLQDHQEKGLCYNKENYTKQV